MVKNLPAMQETRVQPQGQQDPLEKGMAAHSSILAWKIPWTEEPGGLLSMESQGVGHVQLSTLTHKHTNAKRKVCFYQLVMSDLLRHHEWQPTRLLCPWNSPDKNTGLFLEILLQGNFPILGVKLGLLPCRQILYYLPDQGSWPLTSLSLLASEPLGELLSPYVVIYTLTYFSSDIMLYILNHS